MAAAAAPLHWQERVTTFLKDADHPLLVIVGPTAGGKTAFSLDVARFLGGAEVINADSRQLYRGMDIGTAKITREEMQGVPHHLLDVLNPDEEAAAGWYRQQAEDCIAQIQERGNVPILTGGSMLYISAVVDGLTMAPVADASLRNRLTAEYDSDGGASLFARLKVADPESAAQIHPNNKSRLVRAVEIVELTGTTKPTSQLYNGKKSEQKNSTNSRFDLLILGVQPPRDLLYERINQRAEQMLVHGWADEVRSLLKQGYTADDPGMKSHGYREIIRFLNEGEPASLKTLQERIASKTRKYAKGQMKWWKHDQRIHWMQY